MTEISDQVYKLYAENYYVKNEAHRRAIYKYAEDHKHSQLTIDHMLYATCWYNCLSDDVDIIRFLIEECGATSVNLLLQCTKKITIIKLLIEKYGAKDVKDLCSYDMDVQIYLIEKGAKIDQFEENYVKKLLKKGCGIIINRDPKLLQFPEAEPYIKRQEQILAELGKWLIKNIVNLIVHYVVYENI
jgi:hypothetical protein